MSKVGQGVILVRDLVEFMTGVPVSGPTEVRADNQAALAIVEKLLPCTAAASTFASAITSFET